MKKLLILCVTLLGSITFTYAQLDTAKTPVKQGDPAVRQSSEEIQQDALRDMVKIGANDLPAELKKTLKQADYNGETKTFYKHKKNEEYAVEIKKGEITSYYLFDKHGKPINKN